MEIPERITIRTTAREREILQAWLETHKGTEEEPTTVTDALKASIEALRQTEGRRTSRKRYETKRKRISVTT